MASASPSAFVVVPDRPVAERPETRGSDGSDGHFAGLMAQFVQTPVATQTHDAASIRPVKTAKARPAETPEAKAEAGPPASAAAIEPGTKVDGSRPKADVSSPITNGLSPKTDGSTPEAGGPIPAIPATGHLDPVNAAVPSASLIPAGSSLATPPPDGTVLRAKTDQALPAASVVSTPLMGNGPDPSGLPTKSAAQAVIQPSLVTPPNEPKTSPQVDPIQPPPAVLTQAALAEPGSRIKDTSKPDSSTLVPDAIKANAPSAAKATKAVEGMVLSQDPNRMLAKALPAPMPPATEQEDMSAPGNPVVQVSLNPDLVQSMPDALAAKSAPMAQTALAHAVDGSALAALSNTSRSMETAPALVPTLPPAPAPPRSAPVMQLEGGLRWMLKGGVQEAQLQLHPGSLGQVTIHLRVEGGEVHTRMWITEPASVQAVQEGRPHLEMALKEQGLQLGSFDLQQGNRPHQEPPSIPAPRENPVMEAPIARQEAPAAINPANLNPHHVELYA